MRLAAVAIVLCARGAMAAPCASRVELAGSTAAVAQVREALAKLVAASVSAPQGAACRVVQARVVRGDDGAFAVAIIDARGRSEARVVSDAALAAAWIDSWLHDELDAALWPADASLAMRAPMAASPVASAAPGMTSAAPVAALSDVATVAAMPRPRWTRASVALAYERGLAGDAAWNGGSGAACAMLGPLCVGLRARYAHQGEATSSDARTELAALATASGSVALGRMVISPELGLGLGRMTTQRDAVCQQPAPTCSTDDPTCEVTCHGADGKELDGDVVRSVASYRPRVQLGLRIGVALFEHVWLDANLAATLVPYAHTASFSNPSTSTGDQTTLPGEPTYQLQLGLGLRVGAP